MKFINLIVAVGLGIGLWAVASLMMVRHVLEAVCLLGLIIMAGWSGARFAKRAPKGLSVLFAWMTVALVVDVAGHMASGLPPDAFWGYAFFGGALAGSPLYLDFITRFPVPRPNLRWTVYLAYGLAGAVALLGALGLLGPWFDPMHPLAVAARQDHYRGGGHSIYVMGPVLIFMLLQFYARWILVTSRRLALEAGDQRAARQALIINVGTIISWLPTIAFLPHVLPKGMEAFLHGPPALFIGLMPVAMVAALVRPDFYDQRALLRRALIGIGLVSGAYLLYLAILRPLTLMLDQVQPGFGHDPAVFGAALVVALVTRPMQDWISTLVDRYFFPHLLAFRNLLQEASQALATTIIPSAVAKLATQSLPHRLGASGAVLLVLDQLGTNLISQPDDQVILTPEDPICKNAYQADGPTILREAADCDPLGLTAPVLMLPLRVGGTLVGIYMLGARHTGINYTRDELLQLRVLGHHLAIAVENGRSLQKIDELSRRALSEVEERNLIAREIHDTIAQGLTAASLQLDVVQATLTSNPERAAKATNRAQSIVRENLEEARRSVLELRAPLLGTESLPAALGRLLNQAASDIGASGELHIEGTYRGLPVRVENQLYRIAQEGLHNAVKYSSASHLMVSLEVTESQASLRIADDGAGFDPSASAHGNRLGGFGLTGMGERARLLGGRMRIVSEPGEGTVIEAVVPLHSNEEES